MEIPQTVMARTKPRTDVCATRVMSVWPVAIQIADVTMNPMTVPMSTKITLLMNLDVTIAFLGIPADTANTFHWHWSSHENVLEISEAKSIAQMTHIVAPSLNTAQNMIPNTAM